MKDFWKECALKHGWVEVEDPDLGPCLHHADLDRVWPADDWVGACLDIDVTPYGEDE